MSKKRNTAVSLAAALLSGVLVYSIYVVQLRHVQDEEMVRVVVPNRYIAAGERVTSDDLSYMQLARSSVNDSMLLQPADVDGWEAVVPLGVDEPVLKWKLDRYRLMPNRSESTFQIPRNYVLSVSNGIRAGDRVMLYATGENTPSVRLFDEPITVASVKSSSNLEVDNVDKSNLMSLADNDKDRMYASRRDANAMIEYVNLNLTEAQWLRIDELCKSGGKLVIAFSPQSFDMVDAANSGGGDQQ
ncbi:SAF domain-containing protein [Paenibacillus cellulosilyticus]|uniref:SAF domain-containing protein n=1 Tax=Paenibacillus cellulosilyticus TaxID=375489 RepID=A0A2V2YMV9_9BACL|nr:SAF domain-containing protein [Paenibacillus cellulosilyticus]PWV95583.1 SAF domain-containing protein [Paenibacillus cellulosilyticus]QKS47345.1 flagellar biosynthesis protein FlgA [Paenibacillus cellulosilyticus]